MDGAGRLRGSWIIAVGETPRPRGGSRVIVYFKRRGPDSETHVEKRAACDDHSCRHDSEAALLTQPAIGGLFPSSMKQQLIKLRASAAYSVVQSANAAY
jgi:hypothetical protein